MKKIKIFFLLGMLPLLLSACTKSGALTGSGSGSSSSFTTITGSANGGLSPLSGAAVNLNLGGDPIAVASATTAADGSFSLVFNGQASGNFLYLTITGGNAGNGTNSHNQLMSIVGTSGVPLSSLKVNEMSTAATELVGMNMGLLNDSNGTITLSAPKNATGASNVVTQFGNIIANGNLNTSNSNLTSSAQTGLAAMANAFAACIENSSNCSTLFSSAKTSAGAAALSVLESGYNALLNSSNVASPLYTLAFPFHSTTGYTLTSASMPGGFTFNNALPSTVNIFSAGGTNGQAISMDASGNFWVSGHQEGTISKLSKSGAILGTFNIGGGPFGTVIDAAGNIWVANLNGTTVTELNNSGTVIGTFTGLSAPVGFGIDPSGNIWAANSGNSSVTKLNASGTTLGTFSLPTPNPGRIAFDTSGNAWITSFADTANNNVFELNNSGTIINSFHLGDSLGGIRLDLSGNVWIAGGGGSDQVFKLNSLGTVLLTESTGHVPLAIAIDSEGLVWVVNRSGGSVSLFNGNGVNLATYTAAQGAQGIAIDSSGNLWMASCACDGGDGTKVVEVSGGIAIGPQFFPVSGPAFPSSSQ